MQIDDNVLKRGIHRQKSGFGRAKNARMFIHTYKKTHGQIYNSSRRLKQ